MNDASVQVPPLAADSGGGYPWMEGITYSTNEVGCLLGLLAARRAEATGGKVIGVVGESAADADDGGWIAGYTYCAGQAVPGTHVLVDYSSESPGARNCPKLNEEVAQGARAVLVIEGACDTSPAQPTGAGNTAILRAPDGTVLGVGAKQLPLGVTTAVKEGAEGSWAGGSDLQLGLANGGVKLSDVDPATPAAVVAELATFKHRIETNRLIVPTVP
jgi:basic membrane lipoprotein Med (substrate-binding protein (PBP1-ABC) superfamily)